MEELNVLISDGKGKQIKEYSVEVNKDHEKKFNVKLDKPLKKNKSAILCLEYDWEEPYRSFEYTFSAKCKKIIYEFTIPKEIQIKHRILEVAKTGAKKRAEPLPTIQYTKDKTMINWENDKRNTLEPSDTFEFQW